MISPELLRRYPFFGRLTDEQFAAIALIDPYKFTRSARTAGPCRIIRIDAQALRRMIKEDQTLGYTLLQGVARVAMERLTFARIQLAAAWA